MRRLPTFDKLEDWVSSPTSTVKKFSRGTILLASFLGLFIACIEAGARIMKQWPVLSSITIFALFASYIWWCFENDPTKDE